MQLLKTVNLVITIIFTICYTYQFLYIPIEWILGKIEKKKEIKCGAKPPAPLHDFAVLICARNEKEVIGDLIDSLHAQTYPQEHLHIFVCADNCTDNTAEIAREHGTTVYERFDTQNIGKGYALNLLLHNIKKDFGSVFDGFFVFDADNILKNDFIEQMNITFSEGNDIITCYRNSKNYGSNWISSSYALWFLRESRYLNHARVLIHSSAAVSGTGFFFSREIEEEQDGWPYYLLTEDIEFTVHHICKGRKIAFCRKAELYDEQPITFSQSWHQRLRWSKGYLQVFGAYGGKLLGGMFRGKFPCYDMSMTIMPAFILSATSIACNLILGTIGAIIGNDLVIVLESLWNVVKGAYYLLFIVGLITTITEWKHINASVGRKIWAIIIFPLFMFTYIPISIEAFFVRKPGWKQINHTMSVAKLNKKS